MSKKIIVIIALAVVIAVSAGVVTYVSTQGGTGKTDPTSAADAPTAAPSQYDDVTVDVLQPTTETTVDMTQSSSGYDTYGYGNAIVQAGTYRIARVVDHVAGADASAREVFGKLYSYCSLSFNDDGTFEMCINPTSGEIRKGDYQIYGNVISVVYDSGAGSEFDVISNDYHEIVYIVVNYGDYDVYFGIL